MSVPPTESMVTPAAPTAAIMGAFGQTVTVPGLGGGSGYTLVSYLTAPVPNASRLDYVVFCHEDADDWRWTFRHPTSKFIIKSTSGTPTAFATYGSAGQIQVEVEVLKGGKRRALLTLTQAVAAPGTPFATVAANVGATDDMAFALREICEDFKAYIDSAAAATGPNGIPSRLLAAVLFMEVWARPKDGSPKATIIHSKLDGESYDPILDAAEESLYRTMGSPIYRMHLHDIRDVELDFIRGALNSEIDAAASNPLFKRMGKKSIGLGQLAMTTAAMALGKFPWRDLTEETRAADVEAIETAFKNLSKTDFLEIYNLLRFPKQNIQVAAKLLAKIKNRPNRFPTMTAREVLTNPRAIGVLATEYNRGAFDTSVPKFKENGNGERARKYVTAPSSVGLDRFFPDPPP